MNFANADALQAVLAALILSGIIYAISAWGGFINASEEQRLNKVLSKSHRYGYCKTIVSFDSL